MRRGDAKTGWRWGALMIGLVMALAACGGGDDAETGGTGEEPGDQPSGDPVPGGTLTFGLEAESDGWDPTVNRFAASGHVVARAIFDPLAAWNADGEAVPYLADELLPNEDFTQWDVVLPEGVVFHDGSPLTAEAVKGSFDAHLASPLTGPVLNPVESVEVVDELTTRFTMSTPWASFPVVLVGQLGYVPAPAQLASGDDASQKPIGTGPFVFESWAPDSELKTSKNADYWREGLPYLDGVTFRPIPDTTARGASIETGDIDAAHTAFPGLIIQFRELAEAGDAQIVEDGGIGEENFVMLNLDSPPLDDPDVRLALAHATNPEVYAQVVGEGVQEVAKTPFAEELVWHNPEAAAAYPIFDPDEAARLVDEWEAENGSLSITISHSNRPENREAASLIQSQWSEVGIDVEIEEFEQSQFITNALAGSYQADIWRQLGAVDPDGEYVWWTSENAEPPVALNFARNRDPELDAQMNDGRATDDFDERKTAYDEVQMSLNEDLPYLWLSHTLWALLGGNQVQDLGVINMVDGSEGLGLYNGQTYLTEVWLQQ